MGYHTYYSGEITITPTLTPEDAALFRRIVDASSDRDIFATDNTAQTIRAAIQKDTEALYSCFPLRLTDDSALLALSDEEERLGCEDWLIGLVQHFFAPRGYLLNGTLGWEGDQDDDSGNIYVKDNQIEAVEDEITNPGPSWDSELKLTGKLSHEECATVLAALRFWQEHLAGVGKVPEHFDHFEDGTRQLTAEEIDALCERINLQPLKAEQTNG